MCIPAEVAPVSGRAAEGELGFVQPPVGALFVHNGSIG
jgi:hypothetical protein